ncbi:hypothetical protein SAMN05444004_101399 [Jannaschia faecimaris]|uniref:Glucosamine inositolphosphorylceramide transferase 1 N-terminal domain-containing protein n=1 Tax=Jannaschia faecimaris TaxID=1244108 RepID=A0A1H3JPB1_9RHOB|nr:hypothetical protein [Jannaschia faecimaris]SDY41830.1 hypothetical protein SAMN05444004_101399 [Jannaschia faecimaris]
MAIWSKQGQIYTPSGRHPKLRTHAANPLALHLHDDVFRVFYSGRDAYNRSSVGAVDIDILMRQVVCDHPAPFFLHGPEGSFFADGVSIGCVFDAGALRRMLFMAWQRPEGGHWRGDIGSLLVTPELTLALEKDTPFLASDAMDPISLSYPWVRRIGDQFRMWYGTTVTWDVGNSEMLHVIAQAVSQDGTRWTRMGQAVPHEIGVAQAFSRPTVVKRGDRLQMWFSYRNGNGQTYRIGSAFSSDDGANWQLALDASGIDVSETGWDSDMICYPYVFEHAGQVWMLYNGNGYGATGFGLAVLEG